MLSAGAGAGAAGAETGAGVRTRLVSIRLGLFDMVTSTASKIDSTTNAVARIAVVRVRKSAAPRALISPAGLPLDASPPPSERCMRMTPTSEAATMA